MRHCIPLFLLTAPLLVACPPQPPPTTTVRVARRADPQPYYPPATRGPSRSGSTVGLFASVAEDDVRAAAISFMRAWLAEDVESMMELMSEDFMLGSSGRVIARRVLREAWQRQFARLDYTQFSIDEVVDRDHIEVLPFDERIARRPQQRGLRSGDLLVRLRMLVTRRNRRRYFDDMQQLWFRRQQGRWRIVAMGN